MSNYTICIDGTLRAERDGDGNVKSLTFVPFSTLDNLPDEEQDLLRPALEGRFTGGGQYLGYAVPVVIDGADDLY